MIAPGLRDIFQFNIRRFRELDCFTSGKDILSEKVGSNGWDIVRVQGEVSFIADAHERFVGINADNSHRGFVIQFYFGNDDPHARGRVPVLAGKDFPLLDNVIGKKLTRDPVRIFESEVATSQAIPL